MSKKTLVAAVLVAATSMLLITGGCSATNADKNASASPGKVDYTKMSPAALAEYLIFETDSYELNQPTQEGATGRARLTQDEIQKTCSLMKGQEADDKTREKVMALAAASIKYPEGGIKLGDWKKGRELAWSGFGFRTAHNQDDHTNREAGGNCYNCHQLATDRTGGDIGPSLTAYGKNRGASEDMLKYTYDTHTSPAPTCREWAREAFCRSSRLLTSWLICSIRNRR